jgi:hypothetical protein
MSFIEEVVDQEFPVHEQKTPKAQELIHVGELESNKSVYIPGDWVEIEGNDLIWRLDMVTRAVRQAPDDWDWNDPKNEGKEPKWKFTYNAGLRRKIKEIDLRSPEAGLKLIFGCRPWVWQQWAILKVEEMLRFQPGHQNDFATKDIQKFAADLWEQWLNHPANLEFKELFYDDRIGDKGRTVLVDHIQKPFELIDRIGEENDDWDFAKDDNINVFTYVSLLGSGISIPTLVLFVQLAIPLLLIVDTLYDESRCMNGDQLTNVRTKFMAIIIFVYYMYTVVPDTYSNFFNIIGAADTVFSRLLSLRRKVWTQGDDTLLQMIGFKLDIYMNTSYQSVLMMLNIYIILFTEDAIEVVLNALAFIFIARIDEDLAQTDWYDPDKRWLTAGSIEAAMQGVIRLRVLSSTTLFSQHFDIHEELLLRICDGDPNLFWNAKLARIDATDPAFMSNVEQINLMCAKCAQETKNINAIEEYTKQSVHFGFIETVVAYIFGKSFSDPVFERFTPWKTWSRWEKVLFLSPCPILDDLLNSDEDQMPSSKPKIDLSRSIPNFYPKESRSPIKIFMQSVIDTLLFRDFLPTLRPVCDTRHLVKFFFRLFDGIVLNWGSYVIQFIFPLYLMTAFVEVMHNVIFMKCFNPLDYVALKILRLIGLKQD